MRVRHKIPSIFSLSMVDVLCCALGCVILLWLVGAKQNADESGALQAQVDADREKNDRLLASATAENENLRARMEQVLIDRDRAVALEARLAERIEELEATRKQLTKDLSTQQARSVGLEERLKSSLARLTALEGDVKVSGEKLDAERKRSGGLSKQVADAETNMKALRSSLEAERGRLSAAQEKLNRLNREIEGRNRELSSLTRALEDAAAVRRKLESTLGVREKDLQTALAYKGKLESSQARERDLAKEAQAHKGKLQAAEAREREMEKLLKQRGEAVTAATRTLEALKSHARRLEAGLEGRFAGITLTGKRVIFLVDSSASMEQLDENTDAPEKWVEVRNTVARLMRSMPSLEKYQIITFAKAVRFPLGKDNRWIDFDPTTTPHDALKALAKERPSGGTNMYLALEAAFKFRFDGLDTVYLLSDGLPNQGPGLTDTQRKTLREQERGIVLGRHVRDRLKAEWNKPIKGRSRVRINTIGFFYESPELGSFLWALSRENDGNFVGMSRP